jgi:hypothetical protein
MEDNENKVEETTETNDELEETEELETEELETEELETEEESDEEDEDDSDVPSLEDYEALQKKLKTIEAQKEHWRKKATSKPLEKKEDIKKTNQENPDFEEAMDVRFLKRDGYTEEDIEKLRIIKAGYASKGKNISLIDAVNDELFKSIEEKRKLEDRKNKAQLSSSGKPLTYSKKEMSPEEFEKFRQSKSKEFLKNMGFSS